MVTNCQHLNFSRNLAELNRCNNDKDSYATMRPALRQLVASLGIVVLWLTVPTLVGPAAATEPEASSCAEIYVVQTSDWLSKIADKFFGSFQASPAIVTATNQQHKVDDSFALITNPDLIEVGWKLCVPVTSTAEAILTRASQTEADPTLALNLPDLAVPDTPSTVPAAIYTLDNFVNEHNFSAVVQSQWIYSSPEPVTKFDISPEDQANRDTYGYRANYWWNEHLSNDYFIHSGIFKTVPNEVKLFAAPWGTYLPRYRYPPNVTLPTGLTTNQFGWRGHPISLAKPPQTIRIAAVGASTTVDGHSLPFSYPEFLEHWLNQWSQANDYHVKFEVINAGREGLNSNDIAAVVRYEVLPMDVDYVIYYEGSNQFHPETVVNFPPEYTMGQPPAGLMPNLANVDSQDKNLLDLLSEYSALAARARSIVEQFLITGQEPPKPEQTFHLPSGLNEYKPDRAHLGNALALRRILGDLDQIKQTLDDQDVKLVMTTFNWFAYDGMVLDPTRHRNLYAYLNRLYWPISYANIHRAANFQNRVFKKWAGDNQVPLIDVAGLMPRQPDLYDDAIHNTYLGSRIRAWLIFESLTPLLEQDLKAGRLPRAARFNYTEHPYLKAEYYLRQLTPQETVQK